MSVVLNSSDGAPSEVQCILPLPIIIILFLSVDILSLSLSLFTPHPCRSPIYLPLYLDLHSRASQPTLLLVWIRYEAGLLFLFLFLIPYSSHSLHLCVLTPLCIVLPLALSFFYCYLFSDVVSNLPAHTFAASLVLEHGTSTWLRCILSLSSFAYTRHPCIVSQALALIRVS